LPATNERDRQRKRTMNPGSTEKGAPWTNNTALRSRSHGVPVRNKATWLKDQPPVPLDSQSVLSQPDRFEAEARSRGVTHTTFRRITEAMNLNGSLREDLRQLLISSRPERYEAPLWRITSTAE
jgi:hypothetical protein